MANCPKCNKTLRITHWRPECPYCGVNMIYYKANDRLLEETEQAEIEHALFQPKIDRAKASFFGSPQAIARVILTLLPFGALFLPLVQLKSASTVSYASILQVFKLIGDAGFGNLMKNALQGDSLSLSVILLLFSAVVLLVCLICIVMSLGKHGKLRNLILHLLTVGSATASAIVFSINSESAVQSLQNVNQAKLFIGAYIYLFLLVLLLIYDLILAKRGLPIKHTVCYIGGLPSEEYFAMVKAGKSELEIKNRMIDALTQMQEEVRAKAAAEEEKAAKERAERK